MTTSVPMVSALAPRTSTDILAQLNSYAIRPLRGRHMPRYLSLAFCHQLSIHGFAEQEAALRAKDFIDKLACGHACQRWHSVLDIETRHYVTASSFDLWSMHYTPLPPHMMQACLLGPDQWWQQRLAMPGHQDHGPYIGYSQQEGNCSVTCQPGRYAAAIDWQERLDDMGLRALLHWISYELSMLPSLAWRWGKVRQGTPWIMCPASYASALLGSLHRCLLSITRQCDRALARGAYFDAHPEISRRHAISGTDLLTLTREQLQHDWWCGLREGEGTSCTCTWPIEYAPLQLDASASALPCSVESPIMPEKRPTVSPGYVYIFQAVGTSRIKIGRSASLQKRHHTIHTASPFPIALLRAIPTPDPQTLEQALHQRYQQYRVHREWFEFPPEVLVHLLRAPFTA